MPFNQYKVVQYGGNQDEAAFYADQFQGTLDSERSKFTGSTTFTGVRVGQSFQVTDAPSDGLLSPTEPEDNPFPVRPQLLDAEFVVRSVSYQAAADGSFSANFEAHSAAKTLGAFNPRDTHLGGIIGTVVPHEGGTAPSDWRFYRKDAFAPARSYVTDDGARPSKTNERGVYVRLSTDGDTADPIWIKLSQSMTTVPEIGTSVIVGRAQDDSELPEVQGMVQANGSFTVTPSQWSSHTSVGNSYQTSYGDSESVRFGANSPANLEAAVAIVDGAYQTGEYRDVAYSQGGSFSYSTTDAGRTGLLSRSKSFGSTYSNHDGAISESVSNVDTSKSTSRINTLQQSDATIQESIDSSTVLGDATSSRTVGGASKSTSLIGSSESLSAVGTSMSASAVGGDTSGSVVGTQMSSNVVGEQLSSSVTGARASANIVGVSADMSLQGAQDSTSITGAAESMQITGASTSVAIVGQSSSLSVQGQTSALNVTGTSDTIAAVGSDSTINVVGSSNRISVSGTRTRSVSPAVA